MGDSPLKKAQVIIEMVLAFIAIIVLILGIVRIWAWFNNDIVERQPPFNDSRKNAGSSTPGVWPPPGYGRRPLTEEWVFDAQVPAPVPVTSQSGTATNRARVLTCQQKAVDLQNQARNDFAQAEQSEANAAQSEYQAMHLDYDAAEAQAKGDEFAAQADAYEAMYNSCIAGCYSDPECESWCQTYADTADYYRGLAQAKYDQAQSYRDQATNLRNKANQKRTQSQNLQNRAQNRLSQAEAIRADCLTMGE